ncbi:MAG TPA: ASPIC/UnbV domain-containing protein [Thermoanaerobaculia bacterium]|nr:ASPIC/UnbV domain-containing protein [Thermoanaerobaculia bacterium]
MNQPSGFFQRYAVRIVAVLVLAVLYGFGRLPTLSQDERETLAARFAFERRELPAPPGPPETLGRTIRPVHPDYAGIAGWISSVGAGVGLHDIDGDGLANDACHVETRVDRVIVAPLPGTGDRFPLFTLEPEPAHDRDTIAPMGCLPGDWNEDGSTDLLVYYWGRPPVAFLRRAAAADNGLPAAAAYRPVPLAPAQERWFTNALSSADVDGDGHLDLIVGNYFPDGARVLDAKDSTERQHMQHSMSRSENGGKNRLLLWRRASAGPEPAVAFADVPDAFDPQTTYSWTLALGAADLDGDLRPEIYFGNDFGNDRLLYNLSTPGRPRFAAANGRKTFTTPNSKVLGHDSFKGMGTDFADLNGDGWLDIYVSNIAQNWALEESHFLWMSTGEPELLKKGIAPYTEKSEPLGLARSGWGWDSRLADFDNDGVLEATQAIGFLRGERNRWPELHELAMGNDNNIVRPSMWPNFRQGDDLSGHLHNPFFVRAESGRYFDLADEVGLGDSRVSRGIALADADADGDLDFAVANQWQTSYYIENTSPRRNASLGLDLRLPAGPGTRPAVGAAATVHLPDGRRLVAQVDGGSGHSGKRAPLLHFGLGPLQAGTPLQVDVAWRDARGIHRQTLRLAPGHHRVLLNSKTEKAG